MTKESLIAFIAEKARISPQRAELAYEAFWEAILSELKTGHFSLPVGKGTLQVREKTPSKVPVSTPTISKVPEKKAAKKVAKKAAVKVSAKVSKAKKSKPTSKKPAVKKVSKGKKRK